MPTEISSLEVRNRDGDVILRAQRPLAICAAVIIKLAPWVSAVLIAKLGVPVPWQEIITLIAP